MEARQVFMDAPLLFGPILAPFWGPFGIPKSINVEIDFVIYFVLCLLSLSERFGVDFGAIFVSKE